MRNYEIETVKRVKRPVRPGFGQVAYESGVVAKAHQRPVAGILSVGRASGHALPTGPWHVCPELRLGQSGRA